MCKAALPGQTADVKPSDLMTVHFYTDDKNRMANGSPSPENRETP